MPPGTPRSRSFTLFTILVGLLHFGQSVDFDVSIIFLRSAVFAIFAMFLVVLLQWVSLPSREYPRAASTARHSARLRPLKKQPFASLARCIQCT